MIGNTWILRFTGLCCLLLAGCAPQGITSVTAVNTPEFRILARAMQPLLHANGIVDEDGAWYSPLLFRGDNGGGQAGSLLLNRLSPAFRFPGMDPALLPRNFQGILTDTSAVSTDAYSFTALQGGDSIYVALLAVMDWNQDSQSDWLALCRITPTALPGTHRDYYLLITDRESPLFVPSILAMRDCRGAICENYPSAGDTRMFQDILSLDLLPGSATITSPPAAGQPPSPAALRDNARPGGSGGLQERTLHE